MFTQIRPKTLEQIEHIRISWQYLTQLLGELRELCVVWTTTMALEVYAERFLLANNLVWAFKWYGWFPTNLCTSNNECIVHWVPDAVPLVAWDVLKVDCGINYKWWISDAAFSVVIWWDETNPAWAALIRSTKEALDEWIKSIKAWVSWKVFWRAMKQAIESRDLSIIKHLTGHGVWWDVHEEPHIYNRPQNSMKKRSFIENQVIAIEPITALWSESYSEKRWVKHNLYTSLWDLGAQREYTLLVTKWWVEVLAGLEE